MEDLPTAGTKAEASARDQFLVVEVISDRAARVRSAAWESKAQQRGTRGTKAWAPLLGRGAA